MLKELDINKGSGPDNIHPKLLRFLGDDANFVEAVTELFNKCLFEQCIPVEWKSAIVVPLHKKGSVHEPNNYRPISLTSILCKMYEKLLRQHLLGQISHHISPKQHGFTTGKSCLSNLLETLDVINEYMAEGNSVDMFYFDFSKAFDSVPHYRLLIKLESYGIPPSMLNIIKDFLTNRTMRVRVGNTLSEARSVTSGVPQGSVLGPLLFLLFINDIPEGLENILNIFADDVKMIAIPQNYDSILHDLERLNYWEKLWCLKFNAEKCKVMHIGSKNPQNVYIFGGVSMPVVREETDLGVVFNSDFNFKNQIDSAISKANRVIGWLSRTILSREPYVMKRLFDSMVRPHLEYCIQVWAPVARYGNWQMILEIENVQRSFTRMISGIGLLTYRERLQYLEWTTLLERRMRGDLIETFKIVNNTVNYGSNLFSQGRSGRNMNLTARASSSRMTVEKTDFFSQRVIKYWNKLPGHICNSASVNSFKNKLDDFRQKGIRLLLKDHFWELSDEILNRFDTTKEARLQYTTYMTEHPFYAKYRKVNLR